MPDKENKPEGGSKRSGVIVGTKPAKTRKTYQCHFCHFSIEKGRVYMPLSVHFDGYEYPNKVPVCWHCYDQMRPTLRRGERVELTYC